MIRITTNNAVTYSLLFWILIFTASINSCLNPKEEAMMDEFATLKVNHYPDDYVADGREKSKLLDPELILM